MPTVLKIFGYRFHFYSNEGNEPPHIHCRKENSECKFWLNIVVLAENKGFRNHEIREIEKLVFEYRERFLEAYNEFHGWQ
ncbi:DUF4160 domain-containing protein [Leptospira selangorensis]|uniref:DUF4160 domain-containing protein n=1 Tax=Leptospira selangorensis TaxID=2484982 RepID=A0A5F2C725_9LEPT|nr:DUF4160 domain-containing protein [Leptospira selangorensis]TGM12860.1 DUF4160 domain-containing protein [Leptospira selangorensis]TGM30921.1 DUF4160 domain-containing protein [Leptospira selangorensis]